MLHSDADYSFWLITSVLFNIINSGNVTSVLGCHILECKVFMHRRFTSFMHALHMYVFFVVYDDHKLIVSG